ncbi:MAG: sigma-70 family RNA polymerase sigma factor [Planctomycetota bacterium]
METTSDERLLAEFLAGDETAFTALVKRHSREVYQFIFRFTRNQAGAEDVAQETFVQVYQSAASFDPSRSFRPWLFTIAANKARDQLRVSARKREVALTLGTGSGDSTEVSLLDFLSDGSDAPSDALESDERREAVQAVVSRMPEILREVLVLGYFQRFSYKEIARMLDVPLGTVKSRLHAAVSHFAAAYRKAELERGASPS